MKGNNSTTELPIIEVGSVIEWSNGDTSEVVSLYFDEDGIPQIRLSEYRERDDQPFREITVTYDDIKSHISNNGVSVSAPSHRDQESYIGQVDKLH